MVNDAIQEKADDSLPGAELVTQRHRALTYLLAGAAMLLSRVVLDVRLTFGLAIFGVGALSVVWFSLLALRARRTNRWTHMAAWWIACDLILVTAMILVTGGVSSPWFVWYLACAGAAVTYLRLRTAVAFAAASTLLYLGALAALGQIRGLDHNLLAAMLQLLLLFGASLVLLANTRKLLASTQHNRRLKEEALARVAELTRVTRDLEAMGRLLLDFTEIDQLTGLHNRRYLLARVAEEAKQRSSGPLGRRAADRRGSAGILMIDVDHFKIINDTYGHAAGDEALRHLATLLRGCVRGDDSLVRWGGDEFLVLLPEVGMERIRQVADRILTTVRSQPCHLTVHGHERLACKLTCSIGWSLFEWQAARDGESLWESAFTAADEALYTAKRDGRDRSCGLSMEEPGAMPAERGDAAVRLRPDGGWDVASLPG